MVPERGVHTQAADDVRDFHHLAIGPVTPIRCGRLVGMLDSDLSERDQSPLGALGAVEHRAQALVFNDELPTSI